MSKKGVLQAYSVGLNLVTRVLDIIVVLVGGALAFVLRFGAISHPLPFQYGETLLLALALVALIFPVFGVYRSWRGRSLFTPVLWVCIAWLVVSVMVLLSLVVLKNDGVLSRLWMLYWFVGTALLLAAMRLVVYLLLHTLRRHGFNQRRTVIIGSCEQADMLLRRAGEAEWAGFDVVAVFDLGVGCGELQGMPRRPLDTLGSFVETCPVDEIWVSLSLEQTPRLQSILDNLRHCSANIRYVPDMFGVYLLNHGVSELLDTPMIDLSTTPIQGANRVVKAIEDRVLATLILLMISPLMALISMGVKLSSAGPVLYRQERHGWDGHKIEVWKFRTMWAHDEDLGQVTQARRGDDRVTPFGALLRRTSLDELPQFINVLQGRMSIVGPRPHAIEHNELYSPLVDHYSLRNKVKPGITGWAQVNGWRGETQTLEKMQKRIEHDLYYIDNWSLLFDLRIIGLTITRGFFDKNAY